jgi:hypothetical protein
MQFTHGLFVELGLDGHQAMFPVYMHFEHAFDELSRTVCLVLRCLVLHCLIRLLALPCLHGTRVTSPAIECVDGFLKPASDMVVSDVCCVHLYRSGWVCSQSPEGFDWFPLATV